MVLSSWHLLVILVFFVGGIFGLIIFIQKWKVKNIQKLAAEMGFAFYTESTLPPQYRALSTHIPYFLGFEFFLVGEIENKKVFFTQYLRKIPSQFPYQYVIFSLFSQPLQVSEEQRKIAQSQVESRLKGALFTHEGIFYYHAIPWTLQSKHILPLCQKIIELVKEKEQQ